MEKWEIKLRAKLEKEVPDGMYELGDEEFKLWTGKGGYINFQVEMTRIARNMKKDVEKVQQEYPFLTAEKIDEVLSDIFCNIEDTEDSNSKWKDREEGKTD